ncbi:MAG: hypothetical protein LBD21_01065 [Tannerellaceae bacterium]|jgi:hypothetical protein|nr:hypothetical protein [Tannerellaceae bacterium]
MKKMLHFAGHIAIGMVMAAACSFAVMLLWNALLPDIFGLKTIDALQALGLLALARILFGGFGGAHRWLGMKHRMFHRGQMHKKWMRMSDDERKEFVKHHLHHAHRHDAEAERKD